MAINATALQAQAAAIAAKKAVAVPAAPASAAAVSAAAASALPPPVPPVAPTPTAPAIPPAPPINIPIELVIKTAPALTLQARQLSAKAMRIAIKAEAAVAEGDLGKAVTLANEAVAVAKNASNISSQADNMLSGIVPPYSLRPQVRELLTKSPATIGKANTIADQARDKARGILLMADPSKVRNYHGVLTLMGEGQDHSFGTGSANVAKGVVGGIFFGALGLPVRILGALTGGTGGRCENRVSRTLNKWGNKGLSYGKDKFTEVWKGAPAEVAIGAIAPEYEAAYRKATNTQGPVDFSDPSTIGDYFDAHRSEVMVDPAHNVHYLIDAPNGMMYFEDRLTTPPQYRAIAASIKATGEAMTDPGKLLHTARAVIVMMRSTSQDIRNCLSTFDLVVLTIKNSGTNEKPNAEVTLRGFNHNRDVKTGKWQKGQLFYHNPNEMFGGTSIKVEKSDADALGRVMGMTDKEDVKGSKTSTSPNGSSTTPTSPSVIPSAPKGKQVVSVQGDGECGFRALDMGRAALNKVEQSKYVAAYNDPKNFNHAKVIRNQISNQLQSKWDTICAMADDTPAAKRKKKETLKNFLGEMQVVLQTATGSKADKKLTTLATNLQEAIDAVDGKPGATIKLKDGSAQIKVIAPFKSFIKKLNKSEGGFQADNFLIQLYAEANSKSVHTHQYVGDKWVETVACPQHKAQGEIHLKYSGSGAAGHYELLIPEAAAPAPVVPAPKPVAPGAPVASTTTSASSAAPATAAKVKVTV